MSKEKDKKFVDIEDPLAGLGFDGEEEEVVEEMEELCDETAEETEAITEDIEEAATEPKPSFGEKMADIKAKTAEVLKPVTDAAAKKVSVKNTAIILCNVVLIAIVAAVLIFSFYSGATYSSGRSVARWAEEWNEISFSDTCTYTLYSSYEGNAKMETMMVSDTDHVYFTKKDIKALEKGETVAMFDGLADVTVETYKGDFKKAVMSIDYEDLCEFYFGEDYAFDAHTYAPDFFEDSTFRVLSYMAVFMNGFNDKCNNEDELLTAAMDLYLRNGDAYSYEGTNRMTFGDYAFTIYYTTEDHLVVVSDSDMSATDVSASDVSGSDVSATDVSASVEQHLIVNVSCEYTKAGEKKHEADWSWWNEIFPKKDKTASVGVLTDQQYGSEISESDAGIFSETDMSETDTSTTDAE